MNRTRIGVNAVLVVALLGTGTVAWQASRSDTASVSTDGPTEAVKKGDVTATVSASGSVTSSTETKVSFAQSGRVVEVMVKEGQTVKAGDALARIDDGPQKAALASATASLASARERSAKTRNGLSSAERDQNAAQAAQSGESVRTAEVGLSNARESASLNAASYDASVEQAAASVATAERALIVAKEKAKADDEAASSSVATARASAEATLASTATDVAAAESAATTAYETLTEAERQLALLKGNLTTARTSSIRMRRRTQRISWGW